MLDRNFCSPKLHHLVWKRSVQWTNICFHKCKSQFASYRRKVNVWIMKEEKMGLDCKRYLASNTVKKVYFLKKKSPMLSGKSVIEIVTCCFVFNDRRNFCNILQNVFSWKRTQCSVYLFSSTFVSVLAAQTIRKVLHVCPVATSSDLSVWRNILREANAS